MTCPAFGTLTFFIPIQKCIIATPVERPQLAHVGVCVLVVLRILCGKGADVTVYPIRTGEQQTCRASENSRNGLDALQAGCTMLSVQVSGHIAIFANDQCLGHLWIVVKKLEQALDHALGMGGIVRVLPEEQRDTQGSGIASTKNSVWGSGVLRLFGWCYRKHRNWPVGHGVTG
ncbi:hypothetical protein D3C76_446020 [compost metagenome]